MKKYKLPTFVTIGVAKSGTTSLHYALGEHPKIQLSKRKETYFFNVKSRYDGGVNYYKTMFHPCAEDEICGETTPYYLYFKEVPARVKNYIPNVKLIVMLRNPIDRAYSHFYGYLRLCKMRNQKPVAKDLKDFLKIAKESPKKVGHNHRGKNLLPAGLYGEQMERWLKYFPLEQFKIIKSEDFFENPQKIINEVFDFLGIERHPVKIKHWLKTIESNKRTLGVERYSILDEETRQMLYEYYEDSNRLLYKLIGRDMKWKK